MKPVSLKRIRGFTFWACAFFWLHSVALGTIYTTVDLVHPLDSLGHSARAAAMGSAFAAVEGDSACLFFNPAGLASLSGLQLSLHHNSFIGDLFQDTLIAAGPLEDLGVLALSASYLNYGTLDGYDTAGNPTGAYQPNRISFSLGWGGKIFQDISLGISVKRSFQSITPNIFQSLTLDGGILWQATPRLRLALVYNDFALSIPGYSSSGVLRAGLSWMIPEKNDASTLLTFALSMPPYGVYRVQLGVEQTLISDFFLRAGYQFDLVDNEIPGFQGPTAGFGMRFEDFRLDYAFLPEGDLGNSHRVSFSFQIDKKSEVPTPSPTTPIAPTTPTPTVTPQPVPTLSPVENPVNFKPSKNIRPQDKAETIELKFRLPDRADAPLSTILTPEWIQAIDSYERKVQENPKKALNWRRLGALYFKTGRAEEGYQCLDQSLKLNPHDKELRKWLEKSRPKKK